MGVVAGRKACGLLVWMIQWNARGKTFDSQDQQLKAWPQSTKHAKKLEAPTLDMPSILRPVKYDLSVEELQSEMTSMDKKRFIYFKVGIWKFFATPNPRYI